MPTGVTRRRAGMSGHGLGRECELWSGVGWGVGGTGREGEREVGPPIDGMADRIWSDACRDERGGKRAEGLGYSRANSFRGRRECGRAVHALGSGGGKLQKYPCPPWGCHEVCVRCLLTDTLLATGVSTTRVSLRTMPRASIEEMDDFGESRNAKISPARQKIEFHVCTSK
jgi:hypothetical protein